MIDLKLTEKASAIAIAVLALVIVLVSAVTYVRDEPFYIAGKEFGFGGNESKRKATELENCHADSDKLIARARQLLADAKAQNDKLQEANKAYLAQEELRAHQANAMWFPIDDVDFFRDGKFSTSVGRAGMGKWSDRDSELTLKFVETGDTDVVLETNLPAPWNRVRIPYRDAILVSMKKWDYRLSLQEVYSEKSVVRIERRTKA